MRDVKLSNRLSRGANLAFALAVTGGLIALLYFLPQLMVASDTQIVWRSVALLLFTAAVLGASLYLSGVAPAELGFVRWRWRALLTIVIALVGMVAILAAWSLGWKSLGVTQSEAMTKAVAAHSVALIFLIALTAAVSEEILMRGVITHHLGAAAGSLWTGAFASLLLFSALHAVQWDWPQVVLTLGPATALTLTYLWTRNLWVVIVVHFLVDFIGISAAHFAR